MAVWRTGLVVHRGIDDVTAGENVLAGHVWLETGVGFRGNRDDRVAEGFVHWCTGVPPAWYSGRSRHGGVELNLRGDVVWKARLLLVWVERGE